MIHPAISLAISIVVPSIAVYSLFKNTSKTRKTEMDNKASKVYVDDKIKMIEKKLTVELAHVSKEVHDSFEEIKTLLEQNQALVNEREAHMNEIWSLKIQTISDILSEQKSALNEQRLTMQQQSQSFLEVRQALNSHLQSHGHK